MRALTLFATGTLAACADRPDTYIVPLVELDAEMQLVEDDRYVFGGGNMIRLFAAGEPCLVLSPRNTTVSVNGVAGTMDPGHPERDRDPCYGPAMVFDSGVPNTTGRSTFEIGDGSATWVFEIWDPFDYPEFVLVTPQPVMIGQTVVFHVDTTGTLNAASVFARDDNFDTVLDLDETSGVTISGNDVSFVMPDIPATITTLEVEVRAPYDVRIDRCDAPRGCRPLADQPAFSRIDLEIVRP